MDRPLLLHFGFVTGVVGGILIVAAAVLMLAMMALMGGMMMPMMGGHMGAAGWTGMGFGMLLWAAVAGVIVLVGAIQIRGGKSPLGWGIALIVAGVLSFPVMGGFLVGGIAAIAAGILAIAAATPRASRPPPAV